jgi:hypothetical protein
MPVVAELFYCPHSACSPAVRRMAAIAAMAANTGWRLSFVMEPATSPRAKAGQSPELVEIASSSKFLQPAVSFTS